MFDSIVFKDKGLVPAVEILSYTVNFQNVVWQEIPKYIYICHLFYADTDMLIQNGICCIQ
jgi:hypothetical protein